MTDLVYISLSDDVPHLIPTCRVNLQVEAFDRDVGDNGRVEYSLMETASIKGRFRIHPHSGVVYAQKSLSAGQEFSFSVSTSFLFASRKTSLPTSRHDDDDDILSSSNFTEPTHFLTTRKFHRSLARYAMSSIQWPGQTSSSALLLDS